MDMTHTLSVDRRGFVKLSIAGAICATVSGSAISREHSRAFASDAEPSYKPGTYRGTGRGRGGELVVEATFSENALTGLEVVSHNETRYISDMAIAELPGRIVEYQSLGLDGITGATLTSYAIFQATADCVEQAGGDPSALEKVPGPEKSTTTEELDADIVIVGAGASGMAAAIAAAQEGASNVVVLEKTSNIGGNALVSGGYMHYINAPVELRVDNNEGYTTLFAETMQRAADAGIDQDLLDKIQADYDAWNAEGSGKVFDSAEFMALDYYLANGGTFEKWLAYAPHVVELDTWLDEMGFSWKKLTGIVGYPWPRHSGSTTGKCGEGFFDLFSKELDTADLPITLIPLTSATELIVQDGAVTGVVGVHDDGTTYRITSKRGVILASGGYSGNPKMLKQYNTYWDWTDDTIIPTTNAYGHTGDGITMVLAAGGQATYMEKPMVFPYADRKDFSTETIVGDTSCCLFVNADGKRFVNESADRYTMSQAMMKQPGGFAFIISDRKNSLITDEGVTPYGADEEFLIENGQLFRADTLAELATKIEVDPAALEETVAAYNKMAETGTDEQFGRTVFNEDAPIDEGPFYASPRAWAAHITLGGIVVDDEYRALDETGAPIEGLRCVGELVAERSGTHCMCTGLYAARQVFAQ